MSQDTTDLESLKATLHALQVKNEMLKRQAIINAERQRLVGKIEALRRANLQLEQRTRETELVWEDDGHGGCYVRKEPYRAEDFV